MNELTETVSRLVTLLEDAVEERDWDIVFEVSNELNELYEELDKQSHNFLDNY